MNGIIYSQRECNINKLVLEGYDNWLFNGIHSIKRFGAKQRTPKYNLVLTMSIIKSVSFSFFFFRK